MMQGTGKMQDSQPSAAMGNPGKDQKVRLRNAALLLLSRQGLAVQFGLVANLDLHGFLHVLGRLARKADLVDHKL